MAKRWEESLTERVHRALREAILLVQINPGTPLSEKALAEQFGTSKTPVREALSRLCAEGLVRVIPFKGYYVSPISFGDVQRLYQFRLLLETGGVELLARMASPAQMEQLMALAHREPSEAVSFSQANTAFHMGMAALTQNDRLVAALRDCIENLERILIIGRGRGDLLWEEHVAVAEAVARRDGAEARRLMAQHIERSQRNAFDQLLAFSDTLDQ